jgi:hypothetical protein
LPLLLLFLRLELNGEGRLMRVGVGCRSLEEADKVFYEAQFSCGVRYVAQRCADAIREAVVLISDSSGGAP